jgi:predicted transporter
VKIKESVSKSRREGVSIVEWLIIFTLAAYIVFGLTVFVQKQWNSLTEVQKEQIIEDMSRAAQETTFLT